MSRKAFIVVILLLILCAVLAFRMAAAPEDGVTVPGSQILPGESFPQEDPPAQPGEGPEGLPTPAV
ncbi:MAG: hypothetical protein IJZ39_06910 [Oscillospiraceae bacterium]|nr:hypothetical protein [Oscillospiraceae bacterium]